MNVSVVPSERRATIHNGHSTQAPSRVSETVNSPVTLMSVATRESPSHRHLVITVHGIRTIGLWQERLESLIKSRDATIDVQAVSYGYFSALAFVLLPLRWLATLRMRRILRHAFRERDWDRIDLVAHSFGTHLVAHAIRGMSPKERTGYRLHTIILAGSVMRPWFPWHRLLSGPGGCVKRVVNDCGTKDSILCLSQMIPLTGMAGRVGFRGALGVRLRNRYFRFGHSDYFLQPGFMERWWVPLLVSNTDTESHDERETTSFGAQKEWLLGHAEPVKLCFYAAILAAPTYAITDILQRDRAESLRLRREARVQQIAEESRRQLQVGNADLGALLSRQALMFTRKYGLQPSAATFSALRESVAVSHLRSVLYSGEVTAAALGMNAVVLMLPDGTLQVHDPNAHFVQPVRVKGSAMEAGSVAISERSGRIIFVAGNDGSVRRVDAGGAKPTTSYIAPRVSESSQAPPRIALAPDDSIVATLFNGRLRLLRHNGELIQKPTDSSRWKVSDIAFHPHKALLALAAATQVVILDLSNEDNPRAVSLDDAWGIGEISQVEFEGDMVWARKSDTVHGWRFDFLEYYDSKHLRRTLFKSVYDGTVPGLTAMTFDFGKLRLASDNGIGGAELHTARVTENGEDLERQSDVVQSPIRHIVANNDDILLIGPSETTIVSGPRRFTLDGQLDKSALGYRTDGGMLADRTVARSESGGAIRGMAFSPSSRLFAALGTSWCIWPNLEASWHTCIRFRGAKIGVDGENTFVLPSNNKLFRMEMGWQSVPERRIAPILEPVEDGSAIAFDAGARHVAIVEQQSKRVRVYDRERGAVTAEGSTQVNIQPSSMSISDDGRWIAALDEGSRPTLFEVQSAPSSIRAHHIQLTTNAGSVTGIVVSGDGHTVAVRTENGDVRLWPTHSLAGPPVVVSDRAADLRPFALSRDGTLLAVANLTGAVRLWPLGSREPVTIMVGGRITALAFDTAGYRLGVGREDGTVRIIPTNVEGLAAAVCARVWRNLTAEQWRMLIGPEEDYVPTCQ